MTKNVAPVCSWKLLLLLISINWPNLVTEWVVVQKCSACGSKKYSKMHPVSCTDTHHNVTDFVSHGMVKNTKTWISWKRNIFSLRNKKNSFLAYYNVGRVTSSIFKLLFCVCLVSNYDLNLFILKPFYFMLGYWRNRCVLLWSVFIWNNVWRSIGFTFCGKSTK